MEFTVRKGSEKDSHKGVLGRGLSQKVPRTPSRRVQPLRGAPY